MVLRERDTPRCANAAIALENEVAPMQRSPSSPTWHTVEDEADAWSIELAVDVLDAVSRNSAATDDAFYRRAQLVKRVDQPGPTEASACEQQQLAYVEHLHSTIQTLHAELERYQQSWRSVSTCTAGGNFSRGSETVLPPASAGSGTKRPAVSSALMRSPLAARVSGSTSRHFGSSGAIASAPPDRDHSQEWTNVLGRTAELRITRNATNLLPVVEPSPRELHAAAKLISTREGRLKEIMREKAHWEQEYQLMREQVVAEKMRQVELFHRLEVHKREHAQRCERLERALREAQHENELLKSQLAEARVKLVYQRNALTDVLRLAKEEKEGLVCTIAETRHKFKEWKDGEASTLKAARDQAVHTLKTEYELKIARHHSEKQKLRDKVKDLEVSLRLLQKDRHLSPQELSLRKATILGSRDTGATAEAELIEAHCRIKELEALLDHAKEYQKRQEKIIRMSEASIAKLEQEREVVALEHATLLQPLTSLSAMDTTRAAPLSPSNERKLCRRPSKMAPANEMNLARPSGTRFSAGNDSMLSLNQSSSTASFKPGGGDTEKELLRRQSIVLSAEVEKYRHMVVQSLDEIRTLRDNRRRSLLSPQSGSGTNSAHLVSAREQYLMNELFKVQKELDAMKEGAGQSRVDQMESSRDQRERTESSSSEDSEDSDADSESDQTSEKHSASVPTATVPVGDNKTSDAQQEAAITIIQKRSKGYLIRRDYIKKKRAIDKIKAQYRGYLVRKNMELLDLTHRPFVVTDAIQVKMQIIDAHCKLDASCGNKRLRLVLRVSKDPPVVQIRLHEIESTSSESMKTYYFHLFEIVALLPMDDETSILEKSSVNDIAQTIGSLLQVVFIGGEFKFLINRSRARRHEVTGMPPLVPAVTGSFLTQLHVQHCERVLAGQHDEQAPAIGDTAASVDPQSEFGVVREGNADEDNDLDALIRLSRCPSTNLKEVLVSPIERAIEDPEYGSVVVCDGSLDYELTSRLVMRRASSLPPVQEKV